jgi:hypothetical protein
MSGLTQELKQAHAIVARHTIENALKQLDAETKDFPELKSHKDQGAQLARDAVKALTMVWGDFRLQYIEQLNVIRVTGVVDFDGQGSLKFAGMNYPSTNATPLATGATVPLAGQLPSRSEIISMQAQGGFTTSLTVFPTQTVLSIFYSNSLIGQLSGMGVTGVMISNAPGKGSFSA